MKSNYAKLFFSSLAILAMVGTANLAAAKPAAKAAAGAKPAKAAKPAGEAGAEGVAAATGEKNYSMGAYGMAGCGLGSFVIKKDGFVQVFAATSNYTGIQSFAISSGSSNCRPASKKMASVEQKVFVETNYVDLSREAAQGEGEHLRAFAELLGCDHEDFVRFSKEERANMFAEPKAEAVLNVVKAKFKGQCERLG